jgi:hypothetical protein
MALLGFTAVTQNSPLCDIYFLGIHAVETVRPVGGNMVFIDAGISSRTMKIEPVSLSPGGQTNVSIGGLIRRKLSPQRNSIQAPLRPPQIPQDLESNPGRPDGEMATNLLGCCMAL